MEEYIISLLVSLLLIAILFFALRSTVKRIDHNTKKFFLDKLQDYDYLIEEKQKKLDELCNKIGEKTKEIEKLEQVEPSTKKVRKENYYNNDIIPVYSDQNIFKKYKFIKEKFSLNYEQIIREFLDSKLTEDNNDYYIACEVKKIFDEKEIYKLLNLKKDEQQRHITSLLSEEQLKFVKENFKDFNVKSLKLRLDDFIEKNDPVVYVYISKHIKNLNMDFDKVKLIVDDAINEGIKINYKGILYDYSL